MPTVGRKLSKVILSRCRVPAPANSPLTRTNTEPCCNHLGLATGRWKYNGTISWWTVAPAPDWESNRLSWSDSGQDMSYVPGAADQ